MNSNHHIDKQLAILIERYPLLACVRDDVRAAYELLEACYSSGGKLLVAGNGGSAADSGHIAGELMKSFKKPRRLSPEQCEKLTAVNA